MNVFPSMNPGFPPPNAQNSAKTRRRSSDTSGAGILSFHISSALWRAFASNPRLAAYAPVKLLGSANLTYSARVPELWGPPLLTTSAQVSANVRPRISATIATASLNSSKEIFRSPRVFTLLKMRSTWTASSVRRFCRPVSRQNLAHLAPSMASSPTPRTP